MFTPSTATADAMKPSDSRSSLEDSFKESSGLVSGLPAPNTVVYTALFVAQSIEHSVFLYLFKLLCSGL